MQEITQNIASVFIGRMQPPHLGHIAMIERALQAAENGPVLIVLGSAFGAATVKNPFSWQEREYMLRACFDESDNARLHFLPIRDYYNMDKWCAAVENGVGRVLESLGFTQSTIKIQLIGHFKDASSDYLRYFPNWDLVNVRKMGDFDATPIRQNLFCGDFASIQSWVKPAVFEFLKNWFHSEEYIRLKEEFEALAHHTKIWAVAPYPPVFVTVDAVVVCAGQVLLIERAHAPGRGLLALPGGFLDPQERILQSCLRELREETGLILENNLENAIKTHGPWIFDHPQRSLRGRTITHVYAFELAQKSPPAVQGADDAARAVWVSWQALENMENRLFDDHFQILQHAHQALLI